MTELTITREMRKHDAALCAVVRVRGMHEQAARRDLQLAVAMLNRYQQFKVDLKTQLGTANAAIEGPIDHVLGTRASIDRILDALRYNDERILLAQGVVEEKRTVWEARKSERSAVEKLLESRAHKRALERVRKENRELDDIAAIGWARNQVTA